MRPPFGYYILYFVFSCTASLKSIPDQVFFLRWLIPVNEGRGRHDAGERTRRHRLRPSASLAPIHKNPADIPIRHHLLLLRNLSKQNRADHAAIKDRIGMGQKRRLRCFRQRPKISAARPAAAAATVSWATCAGCGAGAILDTNLGYQADNLRSRPSRWCNFLDGPRS